MHSKWQIWDFFSSYNKEELNSFEGKLVLNTFDPFCLKMVKDYLFRNLTDKTIIHKHSSEVTFDWIEDEFQALSLFGNTESFFIHQAQELRPEILERLTETQISGRFVIFSFENDNLLMKKFLKAPSVHSLIIEAPRFWELNKLLDFVCQYLRLPLSYEAKSWMLDALENNLGTFYNSSCLIKLNYPESKEVGVEEVKGLLTLERLDQFLLASLFARKKYKDFFERIIMLQGDFDKMRDFFRFMQSHLIKMLDTSYLSKKPRLTQYDKDLVSTSKFWKPQELYSEIEKFNQWEILAKRKDTQLWNYLKVSSFHANSKTV